MKEAGTVTEVSTVPFETTAERLRREEAEARQTAAMAASRRHDEMEFQSRAASAEINRKNWSLQSQHRAESELAAKGRELQNTLRQLEGQRGELRVQIDREPELLKLREEIEGVENGVAWKPFDTVHPSELDRLNRLKLLASLWPKRKAYLQGQLAPIDGQITTAKTELAATVSTFEKFKRSLAALLPKATE